jgi:hypothetical protein
MYHSSLIVAFNFEMLILLQIAHNNRGAASQPGWVNCLILPDFTVKGE